VRKWKGPVPPLAPGRINELVPGINGPTSLAAIKVADDDLAAIVVALKELGLETDTNIFVTADHGFSTVSK
jgi:predicted AlkP superfamily pyrophosphatase or phosphodiesterase